jgi:hypothetical protein
MLNHVEKLFFSSFHFAKSQCGFGMNSHHCLIHWCNFNMLMPTLDITLVIGLEFKLELVQN